MKNLFKKWMAALMAILLLLTPVQAFAAADNGPLAALDALMERFPQYISTGLSHVPGTTLYYGIIASSPWEGIIGGALFHTSSIDAELSSPLGTNSSIFSISESGQFGQEGIATWEVDLDAFTFTINLVHDVYWHDGVPLTLDDLVFAHEIIAHPDYAGPRFTSEVQSITGIMDYRAGLADTISGLVLSNNNRTLVKHFDNMGPGMLYFGLWTAPVPRHVFEGIPVANMADSVWARLTPVGWGPFMIEDVVPGESVSMVRNPYYVFGKPQLERIELIRVHPGDASWHMQNGRFDILNFQHADYNWYYHNSTNFSLLGSPSGTYQFIAFRLGHWDLYENINRFAPSRKMAEAGPLFRQAMAYAIFPHGIGEVLYHGLKIAASTNVPPIHRELINPDISGFPYNFARAMMLLDDAGFYQFDDEGFRLDRNGERFTVYWAYPTIPYTDEFIIQRYIESWAAVGIRVELWRGTTHPFGLLWHYLDHDADNNEIDIISGGWSVGLNPNPSGTWGHIRWNPSRYTSPEYDAILDRMNNLQAFDHDYLRQVFFEWQIYWQENVPYFPTLWRIDLTAVNNRVTHWDTRLEYSGKNPRSNWHLVGLSAAEPYRTE